MKNRIFISFLLLAFLPTFFFAQNTNSPDSTGFPGDHFSLEGAVELFKQSTSPEDFEKRLNTEDNYVNNLDLNEDGETDYLRVIDNMEGDVHAIVLQVPLDESEAQDIAVIEIEKTGPESAILQIVGDETVFGENRIVEPFEVAGKGGTGGPSAEMELVKVVVNVWGWSAVRFVYRPGYVAYVSPWRWRHYPRWWKPWRPRPLRVFNPLSVRYHRNYRVVTTHRVARAHQVYKPKRRTSTVVVRRTTVRRSAAAGPAVGRKTTTRKTTVVGKKGNKRVVGKKTTRTTRVKRRKKN